MKCQKVAKTSTETSKDLDESDIDHFLVKSVPVGDDFDLDLAAAEEEADLEAVRHAAEAETEGEPHLVVKLSTTSQLTENMALRRRRSGLSKLIIFHLAAVGKT